MGDRLQRPDGESVGARQVHISEVESLISRLPGVLSCRLIVNDWGGIEEVHVLATRDRNPKQIVRDVESCLAAQWTIAVDHKKISVAQVSDETTVLKTVRLQIRGYRTISDVKRARTQIEVSLANPAESVLFLGRAEGISTPSHLNRLVAMAAADALNRTLVDGFCLSLGPVVDIEEGRHRAVLVIMRLTTPTQREDILTGSAPVEGDKALATIRACLACVNRKLGKLYTPRHGELLSEIAEELDS